MKEYDDGKVRVKNYDDGRMQVTDLYGDGTARMEGKVKTVMELGGWRG